MRDQNNISISISAGAFVSMALALLILPLDWTVAWSVAAMIHEAFHYAALRLCGAEIYEIQVRAFGATMETEEISGLSGFFCAVAGPLGGLLLLLTARWLPRLALCGLIQTAFNLLPVYPLDGGRALGAVLSGLPHGGTVQKWIERSACVIVLGITIWMSVKFHLGIGCVLVIAGFLLLRNREKLLANCVKKEYNRENPKR